MPRLDNIVNYYLGAHSLRTECLAALTTFLAMSYIVMINPLLLEDAGLEPGAVFVATCLVSAIASIAMGLYANYPIVLAPGLSIASYFSYVVVGQLGYSWQMGLGSVFIAAILFLLVAIFRLRTHIIEAIPDSLKVSMTCGIGLFIGVIALKNANILQVMPGRLLQWSEPLALPAILTYLGVGLIVVLQYLRVPGAILWAMISLSILGSYCGLSSYQGVFAWPPSMQGTWLALQIPPLRQLECWSVILSIFFVGFFDATGTLLGLLYQAKLLPQPQDSRFTKALTVDSGASIVGATMGSATVSAYIESAAGIAAGGRTGLTAIIAGLFFLLTLFLSPLTQAIPSFATASALVFVAYLMLKNIRQLNWHDPAEVFSSLLTMVIMPFTFSIVYGIASGFIAYVLVKICQGRRLLISRWQWLLSLLFLSYLVCSIPTWIS